MNNQTVSLTLESLTHAGLQINMKDGNIVISNARIVNMNTTPERLVSNVMNNPNMAPQYPMHPPHNTSAMPTSNMGMGLSMPVYPPIRNPISTWQPTYKHHALKYLHPMVLNPMLDTVFRHGRHIGVNTNYPPMPLIVLDNEEALIKHLKSNDMYPDATLFLNILPQTLYLTPFRHRGTYGSSICDGCVYIDKGEPGALMLVLLKHTHRPDTPSVYKFIGDLLGGKSENTEKTIDDIYCTIAALLADKEPAITMDSLVDDLNKIPSIANIISDIKSEDLKLQSLIIEDYAGTCLKIYKPIPDQKYFHAVVHSVSDIVDPVFKNGPTRIFYVHIAKGPVGFVATIMETVNSVS